MNRSMKGHCRSFVTVAAVAALATIALPSSGAFADGPVPVTTVDVGVPTGTDPTSTLLDLAKKACTPKDTNPDDTQAWNGFLEATVNKDPLRGTIQYVWDTNADPADGDAEGWVPDDGCAQRVRITTQITDNTAEPFCQPSVQSTPSTVEDAQHLSDRTLYAENDNVFQLPVIYYGVDGSVPTATQTSDSSTDVGKTAGVCVRTTSNVDVVTTTRYLNNVGQWIVAACALDEYSITATPDQPIIDYLDTVDCLPK